MMQQMQKMQSCMKNVDQAQMKVLEQRSQKVDTEIKALCASGKRDEAQERAISFGMEISKDPTMQVMRKCGELMKGAMPEMPFMNHGNDRDSSSHHVCD